MQILIYLSKHTQKFYCDEIHVVHVFQDVSMKIKFQIHVIF